MMGSGWAEIESAGRLCLLPFAGSSLLNSVSQRSAIDNYFLYFDGLTCEQSCVRAGVSVRLHTRCLTGITEELMPHIECGEMQFAVLLDLLAVMA